jgi:hypothetical protein
MMSKLTKERFQICLNTQVMETCDIVIQWDCHESEIYHGKHTNLI